MVHNNLHKPYTLPPLPLLPVSSPHPSLPATKMSMKASPSSGSATPSRSHGRARSSSGSSSGTSSAKAIPPFPVLSATSENVMEQNLADVLWKTFVAFEQDCRDSSNLMALLPGIEGTVTAAIDPIQLASDCLDECATHVEHDIRETIEQALAGAGTGLSSATAAESGRPQPTSVASHSKQFTLASTRLSSVCSTFRATQASLRYYGGAKKTAYQLDLFIHKCALPTSTAMHKRGQEFSAASKWLKKFLNGDGRILDPSEMAVLRRASNSLVKWAAGLREHSELLRSAAMTIRSLMNERALLSAYSFPPRLSSTTINTSLPTAPPSASTFSQSPFSLLNTAHVYSQSSSYNGAQVNTLVPQSCAFNCVNFQQPPSQEAWALSNGDLQDYNIPPMPLVLDFDPSHLTNLDFSLPSELLFNNLCA